MTHRLYFADTKHLASHDYSAVAESIHSMCLYVSILCNVALLQSNMVGNYICDVLTVGVTGTVSNEEAGEGKAGTGKTKKWVS